MEPKETEEKSVKETEKKPLPVPKETEEKRIDIDLYFQQAKESIDTILADLKSKDLDYKTEV